MTLHKTREDKWRKMYARLWRVYFAYQLHWSLLLGAVLGKGYENKPKFSRGGGGFYSWSIRGYTKNFSTTFCFQSLGLIFWTTFCFSPLENSFSWKSFCFQPLDLRFLATFLLSTSGFRIILWVAFNHLKTVFHEKCFL